jgi:hypothetical protein
MVHCSLIAVLARKMTGAKLQTMIQTLQLLQKKTTTTNTKGMEL